MTLWEDEPVAGRVARRGYLVLHRVEEQDRHNLCHWRTWCWMPAKNIYTSYIKRLKILKNLFRLYLGPVSLISGIESLQAEILAQLLKSQDKFYKAHNKIQLIVICGWHERSEQYPFPQRLWKKVLLWVCDHGSETWNSCLRT